MTEVIAQRTLVFSLKGKAERKQLVIRIYAPRLVEPGSPLYKSDNETASCCVEFEGIVAGHLDEIFGADTVQALQLAADIDSTLKRMTKDYDFYFPTGEGYFDE
jgi:hypothetical protein